ncbi:hypothetical protein T492DRAFT_831429 [Pavlovales sp. CCMP2436]|nr:hypothetical protein T492DRAFT_831429 [Pavlovales sp. CCMP2436]
MTSSFVKNNNSSAGPCTIAEVRKMNRKVLRDALRERELKVSGDKSKLVKRLCNAISNLEQIGHKPDAREIGPHGPEWYEELLRVAAEAADMARDSAARREAAEAAEAVEAAELAEALEAIEAAKIAEPKQTEAAAGRDAAKTGRAPCG